MDTTLINKFVKDNFEEISGLLYTSTKDNIIEHFLDLIQIKDEVMGAVSQNIDFTTFFSITTDLDIDLSIINFYGNSNDSGFLCFYLPSIVKNQSNILSVLDFIRETQPAFDINQLRLEISRDLKHKINSVFKNSNIELISTEDIFYLKFPN